MLVVPDADRSRAGLAGHLNLAIGVLDPGASWLTPTIIVGDPRGRQEMTAAGTRSGRARDRARRSGAVVGTVRAECLDPAAGRGGAVPGESRAPGADPPVYSAQFNTHRPTGCSYSNRRIKLLL